MISGHVEDLRALTTLVLRIGQNEIGIEFQIDTAFRGYLTLPPDAITALHLPFLHRLNANTADNRSIIVDVYLATLILDGEEQEVEALAMGKRPLMGCAMLQGNRLEIDFEEGGSIDRL